MTFEHFIKNLQREDQCFEEEQVQVTNWDGKKLLKNGKPVIKTWPHDRSTAQISYEEFLKIIVNPDTNACEEQAGRNH